MRQYIPLVIIGVVLISGLQAVAMPFNLVESNIETWTQTPFNTLGLGLIGIEIVAKVFYVYDPDNLLNGTIQINDTITSKYVYNSKTPDSTPDDPNIGTYEMNSSKYGIEVNASGLIFKTDPNDVDFSIGILNNIEYGQPLDIYRVSSDNNLPLSNGMTVMNIIWNLQDLNSTALTNDFLPTKAPILEDWQVNELMIVIRDPSNPSKASVIQAQVTSATKNTAIDEVDNDLRTPSLYSHNIPFTQFWMKLFERFPNAFPILRHFLGY